MLDDSPKQISNQRLRPKAVGGFRILVALAAVITGTATSAAQSNSPRPAIRLGNSIQLVDPSHQTPAPIIEARPVSQVAAANQAAAPSQAAAPYVSSEPVLPQQVFSSSSSNWFGYGSPVHVGIFGGDGCAEPS